MQTGAAHHIGAAANKHNGELKQKETKSMVCFFGTDLAKETELIGLLNDYAIGGTQDVCRKRITTHRRK